MTETLPNDQAFPKHPNSYSDSNLTKREYFAAMAMQALLSDSNSIALTPHCVAEFSIQMSEILINELNKKK
jgi:hypothetical protein